MAYFPMYVEIENRPCLIVGGGEVALRKVRVLKEFGAEITVVAEHILPEIADMQVNVIERTFVSKDMTDYALVVAATNDAAENHRIAELAKERKIPVNAVDAKEDCTFLFPSYIKEQNLVGAFSSGGNSPVLTQYLKKRAEEVLTEELGEINEYMGSIREIVKKRVRTEKQRKRVYDAVLRELLSDKKEKLTEERLFEIIEDKAGD